MRRAEAREAASARALDVPPLSSRARFIFVTRHPIANAVSHLAYMKDGTIPELVAHWVAVEAYMRSNAPRLAHVRKVKFEDFCAVAPVRKSPSESYDQQRLEQTSRRWRGETKAP